ncbi:MAG: hypothetical protein ABR886_02815 [Dehalococcoidales bacterium]
MSLKQDISGIMGDIAKAAPAPAYNADVPVLSFRYKNWRVIVNRSEVVVKDIESEADAREVMEFLKNSSNGENLP